jgi:transposase-like protein
MLSGNGVGKKPSPVKKLPIPGMGGNTEELDVFIGAAWGVCSPKRKGYRNGTYTRDLVTSTGRLEEIKVPRDRASEFHTQAFERYSRYEPHNADGLMQIFVAGVSTSFPDTFKVEERG